MRELKVLSALLTLTFVTACAGTAGPKPLATLVVQAGKYQRIDTPVCVELKGIDRAPARASLIEKGKNAAIACQMVSAKPAKLWFILSGTTPAGATRTYELRPAAAAGAKLPIRVLRDAEKIELVRGKRKIFRYNVKAPRAPEGVNRIYETTAYIHPLWSAGNGRSQRVLTDDFSSDHRHHHGIWFPWTKTTFEGKHVDFWNLAKHQGRVRLKKVLATTEGPVFSGFRTAHEFVVMEKNRKGKAATTGEKIALNETWDVRVYNVPGRSGAGMWLFDIVSTQSCGTTSPLTVNKYRYGGMSFRGPKAWSGRSGVFLTSEGKDRAKSDASRPRWSVVAGAIGGVWDSVVLMSHPDNINHPEALRTWADPRKPPFLGFSPHRVKGFTMTPDEKYVFRYRFCVTGGKPDAKLAQRLWRDFAFPPAVKVTVPH